MLDCLKCFFPLLLIKTSFLLWNNARVLFLESLFKYFWHTADEHWHSAFSKVLFYFCYPCQFVTTNTAASWIRNIKALCRVFHCLVHQTVSTLSKEGFVMKWNWTCSAGDLCPAVSVSCTVGCSQGCPLKVGGSYHRLETPQSAEVASSQAVIFFYLLLIQLTQCGYSPSCSLCWICWCILRAFTTFLQGFINVITQYRIAPPPCINRCWKYLHHNINNTHIACFKYDIQQIPWSDFQE